MYKEIQTSIVNIIKKSKEKQDALKLHCYEIPIYSFRVMFYDAQLNFV